MYDVTIIIPTLNEAKSIRRTIQGIENICESILLHEEILVVDDNSTDETHAIVKDMAAVNPRIHLLVRLADHGLSKSLADGFRYAASDIILVIDADGQHPPEKIPELYNIVRSGIDIAIASRYMKGGGVWYVPPHRKLLSWGATYLARFFFPKVTDSGSGFFAFRKHVILGAPLEPRGYRMLFEILGKGNWVSVREIPYTLRVREEGMSKLKVSTVLDYLKQIWSLFIYSVTNNQSRGHAEIKRVITFALVGISGIVVNISILYWLTEFVNMWYMYSSIIGIEISVLTNFILNDYITFSDVKPEKDFITRMGTYNVVCLGGISIMLVTTMFLKEFLNVWYVYASMAGILLAFAWNFGLSRGVAWGEE